MNDQSWKPGDEVEITTTRARLRSLRVSDIDGEGAPRWYGDAERRKFIWSPNMTAGKFLRGLAGAADNKRFFALLAVQANTGEAMGLSKGQITDEGETSIFVQTTLLGDPSREGAMWGYEITSGALWFAMNHLPVQSISMRIYEDNESVVKMTRLLGYELHRSYEERSEGGTRTVLDFRKSRDEWLSKYTKRFGHYLVRRPAD